MRRFRPIIAFFVLASYALTALLGEAIHVAASHHGSSRHWPMSASQSHEGHHSHHHCRANHRPQESTSFASIGWANFTASPEVHACRDSDRCLSASAPQRQSTCVLLGERAAKSSEDSGSALTRRLPEAQQADSLNSRLSSKSEQLAIHAVALPHCCTDCHLCQLLNQAQRLASPSQTQFTSTELETIVRVESKFFPECSYSSARPRAPPC